MERGRFALPASSWVQTPCSTHTGTCTAGCSDTAMGRREGPVSLVLAHMHLSGSYNSLPTMHISLAPQVWA